MRNHDHPSYKSWAGMIQRCTNKNNPDYKYYGGRGIQVCARWRKFLLFAADMGVRKNGLTLDRINNSKGYNKLNCRWITRTEQSRNRRDNIMVRVNNEIKCIGHWARTLGIHHDCIYAWRRRGLNLSKMIGNAWLRGRGK